jgi:hypothetical protein
MAKMNNVPRSNLFCRQDPTNLAAPQNVAVAKPVPPRRSPLRTQANAKLAPTNSMAVRLSMRDWDVTREGVNSDKKSGKTFQIKVRRSETASPEQSLDARNLATEVKEMARTIPSEVLSKLRPSGLDVSTTRKSQKIESDKKRWMLSVMYHLDQGKTTRSTNKSTLANGYENLDQSRKQRLLAAYEPRCND